MDFGELRVSYVADPRPAIKAATEVDRVNAQTAKNAAANDRLIERSAKQLADVRAREARRASNDFIRELERMRRAERASSGGGVGGSVSSELSALSGGRLAFVGGGVAAGVGALTVAFGAAAKAGVEYKGSLDGLNRSFVNLLGSQERATAHLKELEEFSSRTPFEFVEIAHASQRFQAMGLEAKKVVPILGDIANAVAAVGGGQNEIDRVALAIAQVNAKQRVMTQEMNQLSEVGISGWRALELQTGKTREELMKMVEAGDVSAETFNQAFHRMYGDGKALAGQMETLGGSSARLTDEGRKLLAYAYTPLHDMLRDIVVEANKLRTEGWETERMFKALASASENFLDNFLPARMVGVADTLRQIRAAMGWGPEPPPQAAPPSTSSVNVPEHLRYKPRISDEDLAQTRAAELRRQKEAYLAEAFRAREEAERKARAESERQSDVINRISQDYAEASTRVSGFARAELQLEAALYKLSIGFNTLSDANKKLAQDEINKLFSAKSQLARLEENKRLAEVLKQSLESSREALYGQKTAVEQLNDAYAAWAQNTLRVTGQTATLTPELDELMMRARMAAAEVDNLNGMMRLVEQNSQSAWRSRINDFLEPSKPNMSEGPLPARLDLSNVQEDYWATYRESWRESLEYMREDGVGIFGDMFMRIGEGWRSALGGLALDFARSLQQMAAQAAASVVWGALLRMVGGAFGGALGGGSPGGVGGGMASAFAGSFASGGYIPPGQWGWTGERGPEPVFGGRTGVTVVPNAQAGAQAVTKVYNINISVPASRTGGYVQPKDRLALAQDIVRLLGN